MENNKNLKKCEKCLQETDVLINNFCVNCYEKDNALNVDSEEEFLGNDEIDFLQEKHDREIEEQKHKEEMIVHGRNLKDPNYVKLTTERSVNKFSKKRKKKK